MSAIAAAANGAWWLANQPAYLQFVRALDRPRETQQQLLRDYVTRNSGTDFGRRHCFNAIDSIERFRERVPLHDYDALSRDIDCIAAGEANVLTAAPVRRMSTSSGSTRARKLIPYTAKLQREFNRAIGPWIVDLFRGDSQLARGCAYWSISPAVADSNRPEHADGRSRPPIGFEEDSAYLGGARKRLVDVVMAVPAEMRYVADITAFRYATMRLLLARPDLRIISVWHPSFLELLLDAARDHWDKLLEDVEAGTLSLRESVAPRTREALRRRLRPDGNRARQLRAAGPDAWQTVWPQLRLVSCWADAHAAEPARMLGARLPGVRIQPKGLLATEAFVTIPFRGKHPLAIRSHFFEFLADDGRALLADELRLGEQYGVVVTTGGGLWRYRLGDRVEVDDFLGRTPSLRFIGRDDFVVDRFGEKLSEGFVGAAIRQTLTACGVAAAFAMLAPEACDSGSRYTLFIQPAAALPTTLARMLDDALRANPHYDYCRNLGQLLPPRVFTIRGNAYECYTRGLQRCGRRLGDIKPAALSDATSWASKFGGRYVDDFCPRNKTCCPAQAG